MRAVVQKVSEATLRTEGRPEVHIGKGYVVLLGVKKGDTEKDADYIADKIHGLRIFEDAEGKLNLSIVDAGGEVLIVSQFTLYGDARHGRRPSFFEAERPEKADELYQYVVSSLREKGLSVSTGYFRTDMKVNLTNDGPVTILLDSEKNF